MLNTNLNLYTMFCEVAKAGSYAKASNELHMSVSAISKNVTKLEEVLEVKLFYRENDGVKLTTAGRELFKFADKGLNFIKAGEKLIEQENDLNTAKITIGCQSHLASFYLVESLKKAKRDYPGLCTRTRSLLILMR